jgi:glycosyltransferase involved in cell wall biosynthesis
MYFDPWDVEDMTETIGQLVEDDSLRARLRVSGPARAAQFTWRRAAESTAGLYHRVASD